MIIYLIEKIWTDYMENDLSAAVGYKAIGYVETQEQAEAFCKLGRPYTRKDCWAIMDELPEYRYKQIKKIANN